MSWCRGSSKYRGVRWHERNGKWEARIFDSASAKQVRHAHACPALLSGERAAVGKTMQGHQEALLGLLQYWLLSRMLLSTARGRVLRCNR